MVDSAEILFVKSVKDGIPNRDPLANSDARRIFPEEDGRISLSDVSIKRDVRDFVLARYPDGGDDKQHFVFIQERRAEDGKLYGRSRVAEWILEEAQSESKDATALVQACWDIRVFGAVYSVSKQAFHLTGPVQFGWAHSLHPVETRYVQGTVVLASRENEREQGTVWTTYLVPFAVFAMPAVVSAPLAAKTGMTDADLELLLRGLWQGTLARQARGRGIQQPLFLLHVSYNDPLFRLGYLEEGISLVGADGEPVESPTSLHEVRLDCRALWDRLARHKDYIKKLRLWKDEGLELVGAPPDFVAVEAPW